MECILILLTEYETILISLLANLLWLQLDWLIGIGLLLNLASHILCVYISLSEEKAYSVHILYEDR